MRGLFLTGLLVTLGAAAQAVSPDESVSATMKSVMQIVQISNPAQRTSQFCSLVKSAIDSDTIANDLLGSNYANLASDAAGVSTFHALVPSIIVSEFYDVVSSKAGSSFTVDKNTIPKGSARVGVRVNIASSILTIVLLKRNLKIADVSYANVSLVQTKHDEYQKSLQKFWGANNTKPVTSLVQQLVNSGNLVRCN